MSDLARLGPNHEVIVIDGGFEDALAEWGKWYETAERHVGDDTILGIRVSTVFLAIAHGWPPNSMWFETMVFGPGHLIDTPLLRRPYIARDDLLVQRYATWDEAAVGHVEIVEWLKERSELSKEYRLQLSYPDNIITIETESNEW
jgi:hypothetical protein